MSSCRATNAEAERLRAAIRKIRDAVAKVRPGDPATAYYQLGVIDATAAGALGESPEPTAPMYGSLDPDSEARRRRPDQEPR